ncbi:immunity protein 22 of polymorphic toxin system [Cellulophaga sp. RHA19]|uniref:immunity 22 family protein n=1 Tax=Cellulophaga sp. RHA19 TaxID=1798237 RepID=UPI000C2C351C|nr:immunity 22 family protein [Cellulophaga sp. RHA19]PKB43052.1 immunity protein 22 of polymorphic toxin system [Cellulophaga sp. RHA19]
MRTEKSHFWIGKFDSEDLYFDFVGEDDSRYELDDYDDVPVSKFAKSQGEIWIDHDFMESGFEKPNKDIKIQFDKYSYAYNWGKELEKRCSKLTQLENNTLIFINENQIEKPNSVNGNGFTLEYLGTIEYEI